ncbi:MAG: cyclic nucleotide-binding domain-containing protein [Alphaproteobacteria bacterium]|nr:MAG: cyclic nucleotide-binding domain-containing protein [Alphaproteobacteria bacterium]
MLAASVLPQITWLYVAGLGAVAIGAFVARILVVFGMLPLLEMSRLVQPVSRRYKAILVWGGLRGAVTIVLAMVASGDGRLSSDVREFAAVLATLFVLFTLFINATTLGLVMRVLGLDKLTRLELALRDRVLALSRINVTHHLQQIMREHNMRVEHIDVDPISAGDETVEAPPAELALDFNERLTVGLLTLCTQERELYLEQFEQQTLSRRMVARLAARADRLVDAVRDHGAKGYQQTIRQFALPDRGFRASLWLQRRLGIDRLLTDRLADRFEILMVQQDVLAELALFNVHSVADLLGADTEQRLAEVINDRQELVAHALRALSLQYPGYAESIRDRQLERAAIRLEGAEYVRRLRESIIGREVYADLRRRLNARRDAIADRPPLNLGLELQAMIARVPLFAGLDKAALDALARRLRAVVAMPDEKIVSAGGPADSMYFIAAGEVTVVRDGGRFVLREGDFFGEMGLLDHRPRNADVISDGYCHLLLLSRRDFERLLSKRPEVRSLIEAVAMKRSAANPGAE